MLKKTVQVALPVPLHQLFDYYFPPETNPMIGCRVKVPFGKRKLIGIVTNVLAESNVKPEKIKTILEQFDSEPLLSEKQLELCSWLSRYYHYPIGETIATMLPNLLLKGRVATLPKMRYWSLCSEIQTINKNDFKRTPKQFAILDHLKESNAPIAENEIIKKLGLSNNQILQRLEEKNLIYRIEKTAVLPTENTEKRSTQLTLNDAQRSAVKQVVKQLNQHATFLLEGITGSGKTEVYLQIIDAVLAQNKQALILVPEINLTPQTVKRFQERFAVPMVVLHSHLTDTQRLQNWLFARSHQAKLIIGTRSAIFTLLEHPGIIIIDEEHDASFKQQSALRYSARDFAVLRGQKENIPVILGSATPSLESLHNVQRKRYVHLTLPNRAGNAALPTLKTLDIRKKNLHAGLSEPLLEKIQQHLAADNQVLIFLNRRGYAPTLLCHACSWSAKCRHCETYLTMHYSPAELHCHHCNAKYGMPVQCPDCHTKNLQTIGQGTQKIEQALCELFPNHPLVRLDSDTTKRKGELEKRLQSIYSKQAKLLVGTQMLAKGHHFPFVTLVVILNADQGLFNPDFRASEHLAQLLIQVAGRAGREQHPGEVIIQTHQPEHPLLQNLLMNGYDGFAEVALTEREQNQLPPYAYQALLRVEAKQQPDALNFLQLLKEKMQHATTMVSMLGPINAPLAKKANYFHTQLLLQSTQRPALHQFIDELLPMIKNHPLIHRVKWSLDVDPISMV